MKSASKNTKLAISWRNTITPQKDSHYIREWIDRFQKKCGIKRIHGRPTKDKLGRYAYEIISDTGEV